MESGSTAQKTSRLFGLLERFTVRCSHPRPVPTSTPCRAAIPLCSPASRDGTRAPAAWYPPSKIVETHPIDIWVESTPGVLSLAAGTGSAQ